MKSSLYRSTLRSLPDWEPYLRTESGLPGPRGNLELVQAVADEATPEQIERLLAYTPAIAPENTPDAFLAVCGTVALGRLIVEGRADILTRLRELANDPRWRVREGVAMALQRVGDADMGKLLSMLHPWVNGTLLEQRALAAALCEPRLLQNPDHAHAVLEILDQVTHNILALPDRKAPDFQVLRKGLAYCWSVAVAALPSEGKPRFTAWAANPDPDIRWLLRENLKKNRLAKMDPAWVAEMNSALQLS